MSTEVFDRPPAGPGPEGQPPKKKMAGWKKLLIWAAAILIGFTGCTLGLAQIMDPDGSERAAIAEQDRKDREAREKQKAQEQAEKEREKAAEEKRKAEEKAAKEKEAQDKKDAKEKEKREAAEKKEREKREAAEKKEAEKKAAEKAKADKEAAEKKAAADKRKAEADQRKKAEAAEKKKDADFAKKVKKAALDAGGWTSFQQISSTSPGFWIADVQPHNVGTVRVIVQADMDRDEKDAVASWLARMSCLSVPELDTIIVRDTSQVDSNHYLRNMQLPNGCHS